MRRDDLDVLGHRWCIVCRDLKPYAQYARPISSTTCNACMRRGWIPQGFLDAQPADFIPPFGPPPWKYPLNALQITLLTELQGGKCAICHRAEPLVVDHKHDRRQFVRGLLCATCNTGIGFFLDSPEWLRRAADYCAKPVLPMRPTSTRSWVLSRARRPTPDESTTSAAGESGVAR